MRPVPIPDLLVRPGQERIVVGAPGGDLLDSQIAPVEAVVERYQGAPMLKVRIALEEGDLYKLSQGEHIWLTFWGHIVPFDLTTGP